MAEHIHNKMHQTYFILFLPPSKTEQQRKHTPTNTKTFCFLNKTQLLITHTTRYTEHCNLTDIIS